MKKVLLIYYLFTFFTQVHAQLQTGFHYKLKNVYHPFRLKKYIKIGNTKFKNPSTVSIGYSTDGGGTNSPVRLCPLTAGKWFLRDKPLLKANVVQLAGAVHGVKIDFWPITVDPNICQLPIFVNSTAALSDNIFYVLNFPDRNTAGSPNIYFSIPYATTEFGVTTIPFKYRFGKDTIPNDASATVSGGLYVSRKWGRTRFFKNKPQVEQIAFSVAGFISPVVIALTDKNTLNGYKSPSGGSVKSSNEFGLDFGGALMFSYKDINVGFLAGIDKQLSNTSNKWFYANKIWIGFGVGYKLAILNGGK